jgi:hypothetical protein
MAVIFLMKLEMYAAFKVMDFIVVKRGGIRFG